MTPVRRSSEAFPRALRLRKRADFVRVQSRGRSFGTSDLLVRWERTAGAPRVGLTVSKKVGNAVVRNRVKRWLREAVRREPLFWSAGATVVFIARASAAAAGYRGLGAQVRYVAGRIGPSGGGR